MKKKITLRDKDSGAGEDLKPALRKVAKAVKAKPSDSPLENFQEMDAKFSTIRDGNIMISLNNDPNKKDDGE